MVIGIDEISIRKGHEYRIVVSDLIRKRPIWFGGKDRSEASMAQCYQWLGERKRKRIRLAVMDMWKPFRNATNAYAPQAAILFDKFHIAIGMESPPTANRRTKSRSASSKGTTTKSGSSNDARTDYEMKSTFVSKSSRACCRCCDASPPFWPGFHPHDFTKTLNNDLTKMAF